MVRTHVENNINVNAETWWHSMADSLQVAHCENIKAYYCLLKTQQLFILL